MNTYDRFGNVMPDDWYDKAKYPNDFNKWQTDRRVGNTVIGEYTVSTVWLGIDHQGYGGPPLIFETMIFGGDYNHELNRYSTEEQAMRGHLATVDALRAGTAPAWLSTTEWVADVHDAAGGAE